MTPVAIVGLGCICALGADYQQCLQTLFAGQRRFGLPSRFPAACEVSQPVFEVPDSFLQHDSVPGKPVAHLPDGHGRHLGGPGPWKSRCAHTRQAPGGGLFRVQHWRHVGICRRPKRYRCVFVAARYVFWPPIPPTCWPTPWIFPVPNRPWPTPAQRAATPIGVAAAWIDQGICDAVIAGGTDELTPRVYFGFKSLFINDEKPCRPFDRDRRGLNLGEGAAVFVLASTDFCQAHGIVPKGYILGYGSTADADHFTQPRADGKGLRLAIDESLTSAGLAPDAICFINAHGTGTPDNDRVESHVLNKMFPGRPFLSTKGYNRPHPGGCRPH